MFVHPLNFLTYRVSTKSPYNFKNLLQKRMKRQIRENYDKMRRIYLSFFLPSFNIPLYGHHLHEAHRDGTRFLAMFAVTYPHQSWQWRQWSSALDQWCPIPLFDTRYLWHPTWMSSIFQVSIRSSTVVWHSIALTLYDKFQSKQHRNGPCRVSAWRVSMFCEWSDCFLDFSHSGK